MGLLRHGTTDDAGRAVLRGRRDDALTATGWAQMRAAVADKPPVWDTIVTSPLRRCAAFARELATARGLPLSIDKRFAELDFGTWDGRTIDELMQDAKDAEALRHFWRDPWHNPPPQGESLVAFETRVRAAWRDLLTAYVGRRVLLVSHGGVIRLVLCAMQGLPRSRLLTLEVAHASLHRVEAIALPVIHNDD